MAFSANMAIGQKCDRTLTGYVYDADNGGIIPFVNIVVGSDSILATTDDKGFYKVEGLCPESYKISCSHVGCQHISRDISLKENITRLDFSLHHDHKTLHEVTITGSIPKDREGVSSSVRNEELTLSKSRGLADAVASISGTSMLKTGATIAKPVIHGLLGNRVLIMNDGMKLESQQWGLDHAPEIDLNTTDKVTVVKGAASLRYGGDAIGGVVLMEKNDLPESRAWHGNILAGGFSNGRTGLISAKLKSRPFEHIPLSFEVEGSLKRGGNISTPDYYLGNTGQYESSYGIRAQYLLRKGLTIGGSYSMFNQKLGIFRSAHISNVSDLLNAYKLSEPYPKADFTYEIDRPYQKILHEWGAVWLDYDFGKGNLLNLRFNRQFDRRQEMEYHKPGGTFDNSDSRPQQQFGLLAYAGTADLSHRLTPTISGNVGLSYTYKYNLLVAGTFLPDYHQNQFGLYWIEKWSRPDRPYSVEGGIRWDLSELAAMVPNTDGDKRNYSLPSATLGLKYKVLTNAEVSFYMALANRQPSPDELYSKGVHGGTATYIIGNPDLTTEKSLQFNLNVNYHFGDRFRVNLTGYINRINGFIYKWIDSLPTLSAYGAFLTTRYRQTDATLKGIDLDVEWEFINRLTLSGKFSYLYAFNDIENDFIPLMPPTSGTLGLRYKLKPIGPLAQSFIMLNSEMAAKQGRVPKNNTEPIPPPPGYVLFNLRFGTNFLLAHSRVIGIQFGVENVFNTRYRNYLNQFRYFALEAGRNFYVSAHYQF